jgi:hypothetical protein
MELFISLFHKLQKSRSHLFFSFYVVNAEWQNFRIPIITYFFDAFSAVVGYTCSARALHEMSCILNAFSEVVYLGALAYVRMHSCTRSGNIVPGLVWKKK